MDWRRYWRCKQTARKSTGGYRRPGGIPPNRFPPPQFAMPHPVAPLRNGAGNFMHRLQLVARLRNDAVNIRPHIIAPLRNGAGNIIHRPRLVALKSTGGYRRPQPVLPPMIPPWMQIRPPGNSFAVFPSSISGNHNNGLMNGVNTRNTPDCRESAADLSPCSSNSAGRNVVFPISKQMAVKHTGRPPRNAFAVNLPSNNSNNGRMNGENATDDSSDDDFDDTERSNDNSRDEGTEGSNDDSSDDGAEERYDDSSDDGTERSHEDLEDEDSDREYREMLDSLRYDQILNDEVNIVEPKKADHNETEAVAANSTANGFVPFSGPGYRLNGRPVETSQQANAHTQRGAPDDFSINGNIDFIRSNILLRPSKTNNNINNRPPGPDPNEEFWNSINDDFEEEEEEDSEIEMGDIDDDGDCRQ